MGGAHPFQGREHLGIGGREVHFRVLPFHIDQDCRYTSLLELLDEG
jgi:hypothetical protein